MLLSLAGLVGMGIGYYLRFVISLGKKGSMELEIKQMMLEAKEEAKKIIGDADKQAKEASEVSKKEVREREDSLKKTEERLIKKEELLDNRQIDIDREVEEIKIRIAEVKEIKEKTEQAYKNQTIELERIAGLTGEEARQQLIVSVEKQSEEDLMSRMRKLELYAEDTLERRAKDILTTTIHRLASSVASDVLSTTVAIPSDEVKGKIIGKEGRNIKAFERASGVEVIVDDTPGYITLSSFDPVRRQIAKMALEMLIADGRIQPVRIEEMVEKAKNEISRVIKEKGEQAAFECGIFNLDPRIISILGRLHFRTSYGQNVLQHSIEMAHLAGMLAEELGANVSVAKAGALLHDIGKAVDHEIQGTHVEIGRRILQKFGADEKIILAMQAHHEEYPYETPESYIVQVCDAISGARPGARRDSVENYLKRLSELEAIANRMPGVEKSYALQAGREIRIFVIPDKITDIEARKTAAEVAKAIEQELKYPGEIKVNVIRETRAIEYAR